MTYLLYRDGVAYTNEYKSLDVEKKHEKEGEGEGHEKEGAGAAAHTGESSGETKEE